MKKKDMVVVLVMTTNNLRIHISSKFNERKLENSNNFDDNF